MSHADPIEHAYDRDGIRHDPRDRRKAAIRIADQIARAHPHPLDDTNPRAAGRDLARDPVVAAGLRELLAALNLPRKGD